MTMRQVTQKTPRQKKRWPHAFCVGLDREGPELLRNTAARTRLTKTAVLQRGLRLAAAQLQGFDEPPVEDG